MPRSGRRAIRSAFTLLEIILALAILAGAVAVLSEAVRIGYHNAREARDVTEAELLASTLMDEIAAGIVEPAPVSGAPFPQDPQWQFSIRTMPLAQEGLIAVEVTVTKSFRGAEPPSSFTLTRWVADPGFEPPPETAHAGFVEEP